MKYLITSKTPSTMFISTNHIFQAVLLHTFSSILVLCKSPEECAELGLISTNLKCTSCNFLPKFNLDFLYENCTQCCESVDEEPLVKKYAKARLEVCTCKFGAYPQIQAFVKGKLPEQHPNLQIRYVHGRDPIIKLIDDSGEVKEVIAIEKWNTETVDEFLRTHVDSETDDFLKTNMI